MPHDHHHHAGCGHDHSHDHAHGHSPAHGHDHGHGHDHAPASEKRLLIVLVLTATFMLVEVLGGILTGSLALLADAGHMLTDAGALALAFVAVRLARRPADSARSYGWHRARTLAAFVNAIGLIVISVWIAIEAVMRLVSPEAIVAWPMLWVAAAGLVVNLIGLGLLHHGHEHDLNMRAAWLHVAADLLGSIATMAAAGAILAFGWTWADPVVSAVLSLLILWGAVPLVRSTGHILLEGAPPGIDEATLKPALTEAVPGLADIHHVHAWSLTPDRKLVTLHAVVEPGHDPQAVLRKLKSVLADRFGIGHATIQIEEACLDGAGDCHTGP